MKKSTLIFSSIVLFGLLLVGVTAPAYGADPISIDVKSPIDAGSIDEIIQSIINAMIPIGSALAAVMYLWAGFLFLNSSGDQAKLKKARQAVIWTSVGLAVLLIGSGLVTIVKSIIIPDAAPTTFFDLLKSFC
ncbi:MAG: hypothetical protein PHP35_01045 [Candidatus Colwellbacteria bacterium]|nr:hypothetical protein [Candidatus Colwellbacteria bacterium]